MQSDLSRAVTLWQEGPEAPLALDLPFPFSNHIPENPGAHPEQPVPRESCGLDNAFAAA